MVRSGDEPLHARSPLRLRLSLAVMGFLGAVVWGVEAWRRDLTAGIAAAGCVALISLVNVVVVIWRIRAGPHFQPGPTVPPYRPADPRTRRAGASDPSATVSSAPVPEQVRRRRYLLLMGFCLGLIVLAWGWVRTVSVPAAAVMSLVAMVIPPVAAIVANARWDGRR